MMAVEAVKENFYCFLGIVHPTYYQSRGWGPWLGKGGICGQKILFFGKIRYKSYIIINQSRKSKSKFFPPFSWYKKNSTIKSKEIGLRNIWSPSRDFPTCLFWSLSSSFALFSFVVSESTLKQCQKSIKIGLGKNFARKKVADMVSFQFLGHVMHACSAWCWSGTCVPTPRVEYFVQ